jgi:hypothetical protein
MAVPLGAISPHGDHPAVSAFATRAGFALLTRERLVMVVFLLRFPACPPGSRSRRLAPAPRGDDASAPPRQALSGASRAAAGPALRPSGGGSLGLFAATHAQFRLNTDVPDWGLPERVEANLPPVVVPGRIHHVFGWLGHPADVGRLGEFRTGMMPRVQEAAVINGYTPIGHRAGSDFLCMNMFGETCPEGIPRLFARDPATGARYLDLLRVNRLIAMKGPHLDQLRAVLDRTWRLEFLGRRTERYVRELPNAGLPGTVAWFSPGASAQGVGQAHATREQVRIAASADRPTRVVFARLWWPGYQAEFNGQTLPVRTHSGFLAAVDIPAAAGTGVLTLRYRPPYLGVGLASAAAGLALIAAVLAFWVPRPRPARTRVRARGPRAIRAGDDVGLRRTCVCRCPRIGAAATSTNKH